jgi:bifunctional DNase/RNase
MTHDLIVNMLRDLDASVEKVVIDRLESRTYFATLFLSQNGRTVNVDCRPSDAIAIALRENASIYVDEELMYSIKFVELREGGNDDDDDGGEEGHSEPTDTVSFQDFLKNISPADFKDN